MPGFGYPAVNNPVEVHAGQGNQLACWLEPEEDLMLYSAQSPAVCYKVIFSYYFFKCQFGIGEGGSKDIEHLKQSFAVWRSAGQRVVVYIIWGQQFKYRATIMPAPQVLDIPADNKLVNFEQQFISFSLVRPLMCLKSPTSEAHKAYDPHPGKLSGCCGAGCSPGNAPSVTGQGHLHHRTIMKPCPVYLQAGTPTGKQRVTAFPCS